MALGSSSFFYFNYSFSNILCNFVPELRFDLKRTTDKKHNYKIEDGKESSINDPRWMGNW